MKTIRSSRLASVAVAALLAMPAAALAQSAQTSGAAATPPPPAAAASPMTSRPASGKTAAQRVEEHIKEMHAQLKITPAEQPQWDQFAAIMRDNARDMDQEFMQRAEQYPTMNAVQNMQSYEKIADAHSQHLQKLVPAFQNLYNVMPDQQKQLTDQAFRANAEKRAQRKMQTGRKE